MQILINPTEVTIKPIVGHFHACKADVIDNAGRILGHLILEYTADQVIFNLFNFGRIYKISIHKSNITEINSEEVIERLLNEANMTMRKNDKRR